MSEIKTWDMRAGKRWPEASEIIEAMQAEINELRAALAERDALQAKLAALEKQEPVAHIRQTYIVGPDGELLGVSERKELRFGCGNDYAHCTPLYTHLPEVREPLSDKQISRLWSEAHNDTSDRMAFQVLARAIEAAHGIKQ